MADHAEGGDDEKETVPSFDSPGSDPSSASQLATQELQEKLKPVLEFVPANKRAEVERKFVSVAMSVVEEYSGDVAHPRIAKGWEELCPGAANRLLTMAEKQGEHRIWWERSAINHGAAFQYLGLIFAFLVCLSLIAGAVYCATINQPWVSGVLVAASAASMVKAFLDFRRRGQAASTPPEEVATNKSKQQAKQQISNTTAKKPPRRR
jgi:uncharacterized membrane protein